MLFWAFGIGYLIQSSQWPADAVHSIPTSQIRKLRHSNLQGRPARKWESWSSTDSPAAECKPFTPRPYCLFYFCCLLTFTLTEARTWRPWRDTHTVGEDWEKLGESPILHKNSSKTLPELSSTQTHVHTLSIYIPAALRGFWLQEKPFFQRRCSLQLQMAEAGCSQHTASCIIYRGYDVTSTRDLLPTLIPWPCILKRHLWLTAYNIHSCCSPAARSGRCSWLTVSPSQIIW